MTWIKHLSRTSSSAKPITSHAVFWKIGNLGLPVRRDCEQAKELLAVPDRSTLKGKRD
jgi:hypothetical protein